MAAGRPLPVMLMVAVHAAVRLAGALYAPIQDCDETFNYLEPLHLLLYGHGLQTWEYAPKYALRSYAYLVFHAAPLKLLQWALFDILNPRTVIFVLRCGLALLSAAIEYKFARALVKRGFIPCSNHDFGVLVVLALLAASPGLYHAAPALLPSSSSMMAITAAATAALNKNKICALSLFTLSGLLFWPFSAAIGIPFALFHLLGPAHEDKSTILTNFIAVSVATVLGVIIVSVDTLFYDKRIIAPLNIVLYNVFKNKSHLYGTENWHFYFRNLALNVTPFVLFFAFCEVTLEILKFLVQAFRKKMWDQNSSSKPKIRVPSPGSQVIRHGTVTWISLMSMQPHKEERFMTMVYPFLAALAARFIMRVKLSKKLILSVLFLIAGVGAARILALSLYYNGPMNLKIPDHVVKSAQGQNKIVCLDEEWHLFPGHFFLPGNFHLHFISRQGGPQLPAPYIKGPSLFSATSNTMDRFNHMNVYNDSTTIAKTKCDFIVGLQEHKDTHAKVLSCVPFIEATKQTKFIDRVFYTPLAQPKYSDYCIRARSNNINKSSKNLL